jgi:hypothetical protein
LCIIKSIVTEAFDTSPKKKFVKKSANTKKTSLKRKNEGKDKAADILDCVSI